MSKPATHILIHFPSKDTSLLYRASDGMSIGTRIGINILFGESRDPSALVSRAFLDARYAEAFLRYCADLDANGMTEPAQHDRRRETFEFAASIEERYGESSLVKPN